MEIRNDLDIAEGDLLEIFIDKQAIILQKDNVLYKFLHAYKFQAFLNRRIALVFPFHNIWNKKYVENV